ncbi:MAG: ISAzo13 family transposase [Acidobacteria bacterium]|nr:ISAzo13 family transposase [Acidobacteriota bacterium]
MQHDTAGDPITGIKWSRRTTRKVAEQLAALGIAVSKNTVGRLLKQLRYKLRVNRKQIASSNSPLRNQQFLYIGGQRQRFAAQGLPIISVDSKKKELIGNFKNPGAKWDRQPQLVKDHDFRSEAQALATPRGIYDLRANRGSVFVGLSHDTPDFAVDTIAHWWQCEGRLRYPQAHEIFILADAGGSNGSRCRAWKKALQDRICDPWGLTVTVSHYPPGTSKWNPIEHRLFSEISKNWAGQPLTDIETMLNFIRTTKTETGLAVSAYLIPQNYDTGIKVSDRQMRQLNLIRHNTLGLWNYSVRPTANVI